MANIRSEFDIFHFETTTIKMWQAFIQMLPLQPHTDWDFNTQRHKVTDQKTPILTKGSFKMATHRLNRSNRIPNTNIRIANADIKKYIANNWFTTLKTFCRNYFIYLFILKNFFIVSICLNCIEIKSCFRLWTFGTSLWYNGKKFGIL